MERDARPRPQASAHVVGRYVLCDEIAAGGMATVHLGRLTGAGGFARMVAIKRLHAQFAKDPEFVAMLMDEARLAGGIRHPNVVPTIDVVAHEGELLMVMELVNGESLSGLVRAQRRDREAGQAQGPPGVPLPIALSILSGALYGLHAAHEARDDRGAPLGIVHRDVSPQNILVGIDGVARVVDFGVAKAVGRLQTTREGGLKGKLAYMAPEQAASEVVDRRCDIYAAAVVLWEALTGQRLFAGQTELNLYRAVLAGAAVPPSAVAPWLPPAVDALVMRGLAIDPERRFATALEMAEAAQGIAYATPGQVGAWVREVGGAAIEARAARLAAVQRAWAEEPPAAPRIDVRDEPTAEEGPARRGAMEEAPSTAAPPPTVREGAEPVPESAPEAATTVPMPRRAAAAPIAPPADLASQITWLNTAPARSRPRAAPILLALLVPVALAAVGGAIFLLRSEQTPPAPLARQAPGPSSSAAPGAPDPSPATASPPPSPSAITPEPAGSAQPAPALPTAAPTTAAGPPRAPAQPITRSPVPGISRSPVRDGCNPPYIVDARGVRVPKMECLN